jgi:hypothetical protein
VVYLLKKGQNLIFNIFTFILSSHAIFSETKPCHPIKVCDPFSRAPYR